MRWWGSSVLRVVNAVRSRPLPTVEPRLDVAGAAIQHLAAVQPGTNSGYRSTSLISSNMRSGVTATSAERCSWRMGRIVASRTIARGKE